MSPQNSTVVVKLGGSTLGAHDTTLSDIASLSRAGTRVIVVHGGGPQITRWLEIHQTRSQFVDGLRATDRDALDVVVAVLAGMVNKQLVAQLTGLGIQAFGLCGADGALLQAEFERPELGYVGNVQRVDVRVLDLITGAGMVPVIAPIAVRVANGEAQLLNVNADTVAGEIGAVLPGSQLVFLTDVPGVLDEAGALVPRLTLEASQSIRARGVLKGGMLPKIDACFRSAAAGGSAVIVDGRHSHALVAAVGADPVGTLIG